MFIENRGPSYNFCIRSTSFPPIPDRFMDKILNYDQEKIITRSTDRILETGNGTYANAKLTRHPVEDELTDWVRENISDEFTDVSVQVIRDGDTAGAHTDKLRRFALFYLCQPGGSNVITKWYQQQNHALWRDEWVVCSKYDDLEVVHETKIPTNQWFLFNGRLIHDVQNIETKRITVIIGFNFLPESLEEIARTECLEYKEHSGIPASGLSGC